MTEVRPLRAAIVGAGLMGRWHADAVRRAGGVVTIVADADSSRASSLARKVGAQSTTRIGGMLSRDAVDVVHVCTPPGDHDSVVRAAIEAGRHVLVEKPLAPTAAATAELYAAATEARVLLCPVHQFLFQDGVMRIVRDVASLGPLTGIVADICTAGAEGRDDIARDRLVFDILPHPLSLVARFVGSGLSGAEWRVARASAGEIQAIGSRDGISISIRVSASGRPTRNTIRVTGALATAHADLYHGFAFFERGKVSRFGKLARPFVLSARTLAAAGGNVARRALRAEQAFPGLRELVRQFYVSVRTGAGAPIGIAESLDVAAARDAIIAGLRVDGALA